MSEWRQQVKKRWEDGERDFFALTEGMVKMTGPDDPNRSESESIQFRGFSSGGTLNEFDPIYKLESYQERRRWGAYLITGGMIWFFDDLLTDKTLTHWRLERDAPWWPIVLADAEVG